MLTTDRLRGALVGLAVGDALGAAVEFESPGTFSPITGFRAGGPHRLEAGEWTDDTSMALALADSIAQAGWDINDQARRYVAWWRKGEYSVNGHCFDIGMTTHSSLARFDRSQNARTSGDWAPNCGGNGSIMRLAPVAIRYAHLFPDRIDELANRAAESSMPTHASEMCFSACRYLALVLSGLMHGLPRADLLDPAWPPLLRLHQAFPPDPAIAPVFAGSFLHKEPPAIAGGGYVVESLEAALWAFHRADNYHDAVLAAVNLGDDADTTGAVCGQLAGACWGESGIPGEWRATLARWDMIDGILTRLLAATVNAPTS